MAFNPTYDEMKEAIKKCDGVFDRIALEFGVQAQLISKRVTSLGLREYRDEVFKSSSRMIKQPLENVAYALRACGGNITDASKMLGINRTTLYQYMKDHPELKDTRTEGRAIMTDIAEDWLATRVNEGDWNAVQFVLKTLGKQRGYQTGSINGIEDGASVIIKVVFGDDE